MDQYTGCTLRLAPMTVTISQYPLSVSAEWATLR